MLNLTTTPTTMSLSEALQRAGAHWNAGQAGQAENLCQRILAAYPGQTDALHLLGLMAHAYGKLDLAIAQLRQACQAPHAPALYFSNLAEMLRQKGLLTEGEQAAQKAVALDPAQVGAWNNLGILQQEAGKLEQSLSSLERVVQLQPDWAEAYNNLANTYRRLGQMDHAEAHYRRALELKPDYASAHSNLSFLLSTQGHYEQAVASARQAIEIDPQLIDAYLNLSEAQTARRRYHEALAALDALECFASGHPKGLVARAQILKQLDRTNEALDLARKAVALVPEHAEAHNILGQVLQALGRHDEALLALEMAATLPSSITEEALISQAALLQEVGRKQEALAVFERAISAFPASKRALIRRAEIKRFTDANDADIAAMEALLAEGERRPLPERIDAHFALGKAYMDCDQAELAFRHLDAGNRHKRAGLNYDAEGTASWLRSIASTLDADWLRSLQGAGAASNLPIFVLGMPRSGTTLIEQILASHPLVTGAGELPILRQLIDAQGGFPQALSQLSGDDAKRLGEAYLQQVGELAQGRPHVVDKMPANFFYAGVIAALLPAARIIHCRRDAVDTCLSCYSKQFGGEQAFSYDQAELGAFYRNYETLMAHWRTVLPADRFIEVDYEAVVDDLEGQTRRLLEFLGLPWDDACLNFHQTQRVVRTASVNQVRQPLYATSKGRWLKYSAQLGPLLAALEIEAR